jgi:gas vesicle protein
MKMNTTSKVLGGFLLGAALGTATGLLISPASGRKNRKMLKRQSRKYSQQAIDAVNGYLSGLRKGYNQRVESYADNGKLAIESLKDTLKV